ncbi:MAG: hypothetical protein R2707_15190 [Acidimicrobiales bacterium]
MTAEPTLADDEARLAAIARELTGLLERLVPEWLHRCASTVAPDLASDQLEAAISDTMDALVPELRRVLSADVDAGAGNPLAAIRAATGGITRLLVDRRAVPPPRDEFDVRAFPDDLFGFGPASFADIDPTLHEPGLLWGAARAHVHLRRRRELDR